MTMMVCIALLAVEERDGRDGHPPADEGSDAQGGLSNSPGPSGRGPDPPRPEGGPHPPLQGFVNGAVPSAPSGLETRVDLINGNPARPGAARRGRRRWWVLSARRGPAAHRALAERARGPLPGSGGEDPRDERD